MICRMNSSGSYSAEAQCSSSAARPLGGGAKFRRAGGGHAREPVQPLGVEGSQAGHTDHGQDPLRQERAAGQGVGRPPEWPMTANRSMPSASATLATSAAADATSRPG